MSEWNTFLANYRRTGSIETDNSETQAGEWIFEPPKKNETIITSPVVGNNKIFVATENEKGNRFYLYCVDAISGKQLWRRKVEGNVIKTPAVVNNKIFLCTFEGIVLSINVKNKRAVWKFDLLEKYKNVEDLDFTYGIEEGPIIVENELFFTDNYKFLYCLDANTGELLWRIQFYSESPKKFTIYDDKIYINHTIGTFCIDKQYFKDKKGGETFELNEENTLWKYPSEVKLISLYGSPIVYDNKVLLCFRNPYDEKNVYIHCLNEKTGKLLWEQKIKDTSFAYYNEPALYENKVYISEQINTFIVLILTAENFYGN